MTKIIISKSLLVQKLSEAGEGDLIELRIVPAENDCGNHTPAFLHIAVIHNRSDYVDLESIDEYLSDMRVTKTA